VLVIGDAARRYIIIVRAVDIDDKADMSRRERYCCYDTHIRLYWACYYGYAIVAIDGYAATEERDVAVVIRYCYAPRSG